jgi:hypothetical protein
LGPPIFNLVFCFKKPAVAKTRDRKQIVEPALMGCKAPSHPYLGSIESYAKA